MRHAAVLIVLGAGCGPTLSGQQALSAADESSLAAIESRLAELEDALIRFPPPVSEKEAREYRVEMDGYDVTLTRMLALHPASRRIRHALAKVNFYCWNLGGCGDPDKMERIYVDLIDTDPTDKEAIYWLAMYHAGNATLPKYHAVELFEMLFALDTEGEYVHARWACALALVMSGNPAAAEKHLLILKEAEPDNPEVEELLQKVQGWAHPEGE